MRQHHNFEPLASDPPEKRRAWVARRQRFLPIGTATALVLVLITIAWVTSRVPANKRFLLSGRRGRVTGQVIRVADGRPLAGVQVGLREDERDRFYCPIRGGPRNTVTNLKGEFSFDGVNPGQYQVWCVLGNLVSRTRKFRADLVDVAADGTCQPIVLRLRPGRSVRLTVVSQKDAKPIPLAHVRPLCSDVGNTTYFTEDNGEVELQALTPETWQVEVMAPGHSREVYVLHLGKEQPAAVEIKLPLGGSVEGRVQDERGQPLSGVSVSVYDGAGGVGPGHYVVTSSDGRYRVDDLPLGHNVQVHLTKGGDYESQTTQFRLDPAGDHLGRLDVVLHKNMHGSR